MTMDSAKSFVVPMTSNWTLLIYIYIYAVNISYIIFMIQAGNDSSVLHHCIFDIVEKALLLLLLKLLLVFLKPESILRPLSTGAVQCKTVFPTRFKIGSFITKHEYFVSFVAMFT